MVAELFIPKSTSLHSLNIRWWLFVIISSLVLASGFAFLWLGWSAAAASTWIIFPALALAYFSFVLRRNLAANHRLDETQILPTLGWGNILTLTRGLLVSTMGGFMFLPKPESWFLWLPGILYLCADIADFFDGYVARRTNHVTRLGEILDMSFDGLGVTIASLLAVKYGLVPIWYLAIAFARPIFLIGNWGLRNMAQPVHELPPSTSRRIFAGLQMGFLAVVLLPVFTPPLTFVAAYLFGLPILAGFFRDWLAVSGWWKFRGFLAPIQESASTWLPLFLRIIVLVLNIAALQSLLALSKGANIGIAALTAIYLILVLLVILGVLPRLNALLALCMLGLFQVYIPISTLQLVLAAAYSTLLYLGGGWFCLWKPEESLFNKRLGDGRLNALEQQV